MKNIFSPIVAWLSRAFSEGVREEDADIPSPASHTGVTCLSLVAYHHGVEVDEQSIIH